MNDINATIGLYNLPHMDELLRKNRENALYFDEHLKNIEGIKLMKNNPKSNSAYWLYSIRILNNKKVIHCNIKKKFYSGLGEQVTARDFLDLSSNKIMKKL